MKIGLGVVSYNRPEYLKQCLESLEKNGWSGAHVRMVVEDGSDEKHKEAYDALEEQYCDHVMFFRSEQNQGVGPAKNLILQHLIDEGCDHLFIMEDDILMILPVTCFEYINYAAEKGVFHLNFALHGDGNIGRKHEIDGICVYPNCVGAFSYYHKKCIDTVGFLDEKFHNAWEHVEHTMRIANAGLTTPFWYFADHPDSGDMLREIEGSIQNSSIRPREDWKKSIEEGYLYWVDKHKEFLPERPTWPTPHISKLPKQEEKE